jgi:hypothetical protein
MVLGKTNFEKKKPSIQIDFELKFIFIRWNYKWTFNLFIFIPISMLPMSLEFN